jgi:hypothetical protein
MWISKRKLTEVLKRATARSYKDGFRDGQLYALKEILRWRRILESTPMDIVAEEIEGILRKSGFGKS